MPMEMRLIEISCCRMYCVVFLFVLLINNEDNSRRESSSLFALRSSLHRYGLASSNLASKVFYTVLSSTVPFHIDI